MNGVSDILSGILRKGRRLALRCLYLTVYWIMKFLKIRLQKLKEGGAQRKLETAFSGLGAEIYSLTRHGETNWQEMPSVQQQLKLVEEAETEVFRTEETIDEIKKDYLSKKEALKERFSDKSDNATNKPFDKPEE